MNETDPLRMTLRRAKETKNTVRYEEPESDQPIVIGTLYLQKSVAESLLTIDVLGWRTERAAARYSKPGGVVVSLESDRLVQ